MKLLIEVSTDKVKLDFKKAGFTRDPSLDFSDEDHSFQAYIHISGMPMTYSSYLDDVYIALRPDYLNKLNFNEYRKLPTYKKLNKYNGVPKSEVDLNDLSNIADSFMKEYNEAVDKLKPLSKKELNQFIEKSYEQALDNYTYAKDFVNQNINKFLDASPSATDEITRNLKSLKNYADNIRNYIECLSDSAKRRFVADGVEKMVRGIHDDNYWIKTIKTLLK